MPNVLNCIHKLEDQHLAEGVDPRLQIERFRYTYESLVNHADFSLDEYRILEVLPYDGKLEKPV